MVLADGEVYVNVKGNIMKELLKTIPRRPTIN